MSARPPPDSAFPIVRVPTADGGRVALKRRPHPGGPPVIFIHGLAVNADLWDLPEVRGRDFHYRSLASLLHDAGYDIWLMNLRGHGAPRMLSEAPPGQTDWCVDHFILYDLPAVVAHVREATARRPFIIGASMGAMTLGGFVQGATLADGAAGPIVARPEVAQARQAQLAGCVFAEFPAALRWPDSLYDAHGRLKWPELLRNWRRCDGDVNYPFELLARAGWLLSLLKAAGGVPVHWMTPRRPEPWYRSLPRAVASNCEQLERAVVQRALNWAGTFTGATSHRAEVLLHGRRFVLNSMKAGVLRQMTKCVRQGAFVSVLGSPDHVYSEYYHYIDLPTLVVHGKRDRIANAACTRSAFFDRLPAADKQFLLFDDIAHGELEAAPVASERVYPQIISWLAERRARS
jgi:pimeloyl-ACP methyl ester carboxylesterase